MTEVRAGRRTGGFTMVELILVVLVLAVVGALVAPSFAGSMPRYRLRADARDLFALARYARAEAALKGVKTRLVLDPTDGTFWMETEADPFAAPGDFSRPDTARGRVRRLQDRVVFSTVEAGEVDGADGVFRAVTFHPDGTAGQDAVLVLTVEDDGDDEEPERLAVHVRRITGLCRIVEEEAIDETLEDLEEVR